MPRRLFPTGALAALALALATGCTTKPAPVEAAPAAPPVHHDAPEAPTAQVALAPAIARPARPLRVLVAGDLIPHRPSLVAPTAIHAALAPLAPLFATADSVIANYEAATGDVDKKTPRLVYAAPPGWLAVLPGAGLKAVTVANNHACDLGGAGIDATLDAAGESGLVALGADREDPWAPRVVAEGGGKRVCAVAWTTLVNSESGCARSSHLAFAPLSRVGKNRIDRALARARAQCDATIAIFHGGVEYVAQTSEVMDFAGHVAEAGADAVVIHHPHIASPVVVHATKDGRQVPIFASIGNLVTNQGESWKPPMFPVMRENRRLVCVNGWTRLGVVADLAFRFDGGGAHLDWGTHLTWVDNEHAEDRTVAVPKITARLLEPDGDKELVGVLSQDRRGPGELFDDPCWIEKAAGTDDARCHTDLTRGKAEPSPPPPSPVAARRRKKR
jgi:poly-gamma-glutamate capsule biosynthesis protein CapA/YwtB (metallophosphatase superfamily)